MYAVLFTDVLLIVLKTLNASKARETLALSPMGIGLIMRASILLTVSPGTNDRGRKGTRPGAPKGVTMPFTVVPDANPPGSEAPTTRIGSTYCGEAAVSMIESCQPL